MKVGARMNLKWLIFSPLLGSIAAAADVTSVEVRPQIPFLETTVAGLSANFDIVLNNHERASVQVSEVSVTYVDDHGRSLYERRIDENGSVPSIDTIGNSMVARGKSKMMFNPFPSIPPDITPVGTSVRVVLTVNPTASHPGVRTLIASSRLRAAPPESQGMLLPLVGQVLVWDGHDALSHHRRWDYELPMLRSLGYTTNGMRYSYDLVRVDDRGNRFYGGQARNENHLSWNLPVRSPADGTVVDMESQQPDDGSSDVQAFKARPNLMFGNFIVLKHSEGVYSLLGHLHQRSATVKIGDRVEAGQVLATIGCSGTSLFPHLHYQLMTGPSMADEGVPSTFRDLVLARGPRRLPIESGSIDSGDLVIAR